jgi:hypothetical protein
VNRKTTTTSPLLILVNAENKKENKGRLKAKFTSFELFLHFKTIEKLNKVMKKQFSVDILTKQLGLKHLQRKCRIIFFFLRTFQKIIK